jgi:hypothetical protein
MATVEPLDSDTTLVGPYFTNDEGDLVILVNIDSKEYFVSVACAEVFCRGELYGLTTVGKGATFKVTI